jgi:hypothetical protein
MNDQAPPQANERDTITRYLDLATLTLLVLGLGSWVLSIKPPLLVTLWSLAILMFAFARVREFYMRYRYTRILYWLPLLAGNVKRRVYVRSRLGRTASTQHERQVAAGAADEWASVHAPEAFPPEPESIFPPELPEAAEAVSDVEDGDEMPDQAWVDETQVRVEGFEPEPDKDEAAEAMEGEALVEREEAPSEAPASSTPSVDPARLARLRSRLSSGAQALSHLAPPLRAEAAEPVEESREDGEVTVAPESEELDLSALELGEEDVDAELTDEDLFPDEDGSDDEVLLEGADEEDLAPAQIAEPTDDVEPVAPITSSEEATAQSSSGASTALRDRLRQRQQGAAPAAPLTAPVDSGALRDRLRQRINPSAAEPDKAPLPTTAATEEAAPANLDAAARLRARLRQHDSGESN